MSSTDPHSFRAADSDREKVAEQLRDAAAEGRISLDELDERLDRTYQARTYGELRPITADLPDGTQLARGPGAAPSRSGGEEPLELRETMGTVVRRGQWVVPQKIVVSNPGGSTSLDFREARFLSDHVEIEVNSSWGSADLIFPRGVTAETQVETSWMGSVINRLDETGGADDLPHVTIHGQCKGGHLSLRYGRQKRRKR